ncbi:hypothetical protein U0O11_02060 [Cobetia sp. D5]|uniref:hypothetical protein n=1 Tax=Cobetia sp. D5 TaxID=3105867 RepID=UPI002D77602D|nr:hypothetical protein [Cobetia sp. D5]
MARIFMHDACQVATSRVRANCQYGQVPSWCKAVLRNAPTNGHKPLLCIVFSFENRVNHADYAGTTMVKYGLFLNKNSLITTR